MFLISIPILISMITIIVSGGPNLLAVHPTLLPINSFLPVENVLHKPYNFGYEFADGFGMNQHRREVADSSGNVKGSYGYIDHIGVKRMVDYTADKDGYKAVVRTNEPGIGEQRPANALFIVQRPPTAAIAQGMKPIFPNRV